jgi:hypothetical protein
MNSIAHIYEYEVDKKDRILPATSVKHHPCF